MRYHVPNIISIIVVCMLTFTASAERGVFDMERWENVITDIKTQATSQKISQKVIDSVTSNPYFIPNIVKSDRRQAEFTLDLEDYLNKTINDNRIANGKKMLTIYPTLLSKTEQKYQIPSHILLAFWGLESNYGKNKSKQQLTNSFLTLIYEGRRADFFSKQLLSLMKTADKNKLEIQNIYGSWAGAMGHFQFIPTTLSQYGVDGNKDGKIDIINSVGDAMCSAANYLNKLGWERDSPIVQEVIIPYDFDKELLTGNVKKTIKEWKQFGITGYDNIELKDSDIIVGLIADIKALEKQNLSDTNDTNIINKPIYGYLTYPNFYRIKKWNNSNWYAIAIAKLANHIKNK